MILPTKHVPANRTLLEEPRTLWLRSIASPPTLKSAKRQYKKESEPPEIPPPGTDSIVSSFDNGVSARRLRGAFLLSFDDAQGDKSDEELDQECLRRHGNSRGIEV